MDIEALLKDILDFLIANYALYLVVVMTVMSVLIMVILKFLKKPIKVLTGKIKNEHIRKLANKTIILLSLGLATLFWWLLAHFFPDYFEVNWVEVILSGALPVVFYAIGDGVFTVKQATTVVDTIKEVVSDGSVTTDEAKTIINGLTLEEAPTATSAEEELDKLLKK